MTPPRLRLLVVSPYAPYPPYGGGKMRVYHLVNEWLHRGHEITLWVVPPDEPELEWSAGEPRPELHAIPGRARASFPSKLRSLLSPLPEEAWRRPAVERRLPEDGHRFDVAILMQAHVGRYAAPLAEAGLPVVLDQHNVEAQVAADSARLRPTRIGRARSRLDERKWRRFEQSLLAQVQLTSAVSEADAAVLRGLAPSASIVVRPSGADLRSLTYVDHTHNRANRLIMTGTLGYHPNLDAAMWMLDEILPRVRRQKPDARLTLVGSGVPDDLRGRGGVDFELVERVPDIRPYLAAADLFVAPLRAGSGTRLKLLEAFAAGLPVVATTLAASGIAVRPSLDLATANDAEGLASEVVRLLDDMAARRGMAESARHLVEEHYDWQAIAVDYERDLYRLVEAHAGQLVTVGG